MKEPVKPTPGRRARKALATRHRVLDAAETLFTRDGYAATTIAAIAEEADVAVQTVYAVFGNKRAILSELLTIRVAGDDHAVPLQSRAQWQAIEREPDPRRQLALLAALATQIGNRIASLYQVLAGAAGSDPEIAEVYRKQQQARYHDQQRLARSLARKGALKEDLTEATATDIMWAIANPNTHYALISERRWTPGQYQQWLARMLTSALLTSGTQSQPCS
ncbi:MAG: TetR/AcrR family transcriptional regulator [Actinobacteria bacterium]|nr:TetR/AcrR family transcriptional regulator [Actinomycetota bacterium]